VAIDFKASCSNLSFCTILRDQSEQAATTTTTTNTPITVFLLENFHNLVRKKGAANPTKDLLINCQI
jgi:hypothetical protein